MNSSTRSKKPSRLSNSDSEEINTPVKKGIADRTIYPETFYIAGSEETNIFIARDFFEHDQIAMAYILGFTEGSQCDPDRKFDPKQIEALYQAIIDIKNGKMHPHQANMFCKSTIKEHEAWQKIVADYNNRIEILRKKREKGIEEQDLLSTKAKTCRLKDKVVRPTDVDWETKSQRSSKRLRGSRSLMPGYKSRSSRSRS